MRQRLVHAFVGSILAAGCGGPRTSHDVAIASPSAPPTSGSRAASSAPASLPGALDASMPAGAWLRAAIDPAALDAWFARIGPRVDRRLLHEIAEILGTDDATLGAGHIAAALGLDPARSIQFAFAPLEAATVSDIDGLRARIAAADAHPDDATRAALIEAALAPRTSVVSFRASVPTLDATHLLEIIRLGLQQMGWPRQDPPAGVEDLYAMPDGQGALAIARAPGVVVFDVFVSPFATQTSDEQSGSPPRWRALSNAMRRRMPGGPHSEALATEGAVAQVEFVPIEMASLSFLLGVGAMSNALAHVEPSVRDRLALVGIHEADQSFALARSERGAYFDRVTLAVRGDPSLTIRADMGPGAEVPEGAVWAPGPSVRDPGAVALLDMSTAFLRAWSLPGDARDDPTSRGFRHAVRDAGGLAQLYTVPHMLIAALRRATGDVAPPFPAALAAPVRFERYALLTRRPAQGGTLEDVNVGLFAPRTELTAAACVLVPEGTRCTPALRLPLDRTIMRMGNALRLTRIGDRFALLASDSRPALDATHLTITPAPVAPAHFLVDIAAAEPGDPLASLVPGVFEGDAAREGRRLVFTVRPAQ